VTEPAVGYGGGLAGLFVRPRKAEGNEGFARPNISLVGGIATENGTWAAFAGDPSHWFDDRVQTLAAGGIGQLNLDFYGLGNNSDSLDQPVNDFSRSSWAGCPWRRTGPWDYAATINGRRTTRRPSCGRI
jgi:hypothetical protein